MASNPQSPWSHVVRGDLDAAPSSPTPPAAAASPSPPQVAADNAVSPPDHFPPSPGQSDVTDPARAPAAACSQAKKPAWKRPSNGVVEVAGQVMDAESWPALSQSAKASPKPLPSSAPQKSAKHGAPLNDGSAPPSPQMSPAPMPLTNPVKPAGPETSPVEEPESKTNNRSNIWDHGNRSSGDHRQGYGSSIRRGNNGGSGSHNIGNGGRRNQEYGAFDAHRRNIAGMDFHVPHQQQQHREVRPHYLRAPPPVAPPPPPFIGPQLQARPFGSPVGYPEMAAPVYYFTGPPPPPEALRSMPFIAHPTTPSTMLFTAIDPLRAMLLRQIDYYFSPENLCKDIYLRQNMDEQGWVPISLVAGFNKVKQMTNNLQYIVETVRYSITVELQGEKIRRRSDWMNWLLPQSSNATGTSSGPPSPATSNIDVLSARLRSVELVTNNNGGTRGPSGEIVLTRSATSGNLNNKQFEEVGSSFLAVGTSQVTGHADSDCSKSARSLVRSDTL